MMAIITLVTTLAIISGATVVLIARAMCRSCRRGEFRCEGRTPGMFHVVDPYIASLVEDLYRTGKKGAKEAPHV